MSRWARLLLEHGADLVQYDHLDRPTYSSIYAARSAEMVQLLLDHHADPELQLFGNGHRPLHLYAVREKYRGLLRHGVEVDPTLPLPGAPTPLSYAAGRNIEAVKLLLEHGADVKRVGFGSQSPFHLAARAGKTDVLRLFLERWPERTRGRDVDGTTLWHSASKAGKLDVVRQLLELWPEGTREKDRNWRMPLHYAAERGKTDVARLLLESWPDGMREKDRMFEDTPLHLAALNRRIEVVGLYMNVGPRA
jgi:ankyrin repeat protein